MSGAANHIEKGIASVLRCHTAFTLSVGHLLESVLDLAQSAILCHGVLEGVCMGPVRQVHMQTLMRNVVRQVEIRRAMADP
jgi:hypothetical protein